MQSASDQRDKWSYQDDRCTVDQHPEHNTTTIQPTQPTETHKRKVVPGGGALLLPFTLGLSYFEVCGSSSAVSLRSLSFMEQHVCVWL